MIPFEVFAHGRPRKSTNSKTGKSFFHTPKRTDKNKTQIKLIMQASRPKPIFDHPILVTILFLLPKPKKSKVAWANIFPVVAKDLDNLEKMIYDAGTGIIWSEDALIVDNANRKRYGPPGAKIIVKSVLIP